MRALGPAAGRAVRRPQPRSRTARSWSRQCNPSNVVILVQPPRGFGENPVAIYHDPDLPPSHHYLAAYLWLRHEFGAHAVVHLGKHGNLEWLPGKTVGMSADCGPDAALGDLPLIYPFLVNDPGEGTQAKRRAHATLVDHLIPPMARAETYGDIARLEQLLDEHANIAALDPAKLPAIRQQIWTLMQRREDGPRPGSGRTARGRRLRRHAAARRRLAVRDQGRPDPRRPAHPRRRPGRARRELDLVLAILRARQLFGGEQHLPGLRQALGLAEDGTDDRGRRRRGRGAGPANCWRRCRPRGWDAGTRRRADRRPGRRARSCGSPPPRWCRGWPARPARSTQVLRALDGRYIAGRPVRLAAARSGQRAAHRAQLLLGGPQGDAVAAGLGNRCGDGGFAAGALPRRPRRLAALGRAVGVGHLGDADLRRRHRRGARAARRAAGVGRRVAPGDRPRGDRARPNWAGPASTSRCGSPASSATPSRMS